MMSLIVVTILSVTLHVGAPCGRYLPNGSSAFSRGLTWSAERARSGRHEADAAQNLSRDAEAILAGVAANVIAAASSERQFSQPIMLAQANHAKLQVTFFRHRTRPGVLAVSPVSQTSYSLNPATGN